jgi:hypothetical protein
VYVENEEKVVLDNMSRPIMASSGGQPLRSMLETSFDTNIARFVDKVGTATLAVPACSPFAPWRYSPNRRCHVTCCVAQVTKVKGFSEDVLRTMPRIPTFDLVRSQHEERFLEPRLRLPRGPCLQVVGLCPRHGPKSTMATAGS